MKGVILSGGLGTRLRPLTLVTHKHLLPVYNKIMVEIPLQTLTNAGIKDIMVVTGEENAGQYVNFLGNGSVHGCNIYYGFQKEAGGISQAIGVARPFCEGHKVIVILGDNYFEEDITPYVADFKKMNKGALVVFNELDDKKRLTDKGVAILDENKKLVGIVEKPKDPPSNLAQTGLYMYDERVFSMIDKLKPSARGELEVTDLNNMYLKEGTMQYRVTKKRWVDMGTFDALLDTANFIRDNTNNSK